MMSAGSQAKTEILRDMASNRGLRLVKSRRRNPDAPDYGRFGLVDPHSGEKLFGFKRTRMTATADEIEDYLRDRSEESWKRSVRARKPRAAQTGSER